MTFDPEPFFVCLRVVLLVSAVWFCMHTRTINPRSVNQRLCKQEMVVKL